jgi:hypothetical protein
MVGAVAAKAAPSDRPATGSFGDGDPSENHSGGKGGQQWWRKEHRGRDRGAHSSSRSQPCAKAPAIYRTAVTPNKNSHRR